jgi:hypothetical protein
MVSKLVQCVPWDGRHADRAKWAAQTEAALRGKSQASSRPRSPWRASMALNQMTRSRIERDCTTIDVLNDSNQVYRMY